MKSSFTNLVKKYLAGSISPEDLQRLLELFEEEENKAVFMQIMQERLSSTTDLNERLKVISYQMLELKMIQSENGPLKEAPATFKRNHISRWLGAASVAASLLIVFSIAGYYISDNSSKSAAMAVINPMEAKPYTRHIVLPDSSTLLLHANSTLELINDFGKNTREVKLTGEAYFDIKQNVLKPFIVHTGKITTSVLGTAFNIKAYPGNKEVVVAVTRGKVRVDDDHRTVATLTKDNQVTYKVNDESAARQIVDARHVVTDWTRKDVVFEAIMFKDIAQILSKRFSANIKFTNEALKECQIRISFIGTESLKEMLDVLCLAMNASYVSDDNNEIIISGEGCR